MDAESTRARELERHFPELISYVPDPRLFPFENEGVKLYTGEALVIDGENLRLAATDAEVNVTVGNKQCNVTALSMMQIVCVPPDTKPSDTDEFGRATDPSLPAVVVRFGSNIRHHVGYLRYEMAAGYEFPPLLIAVLSAAGAFFVLLSLVLLAVFRHRRSQAEREYKIIQLQMGTLGKNGVMQTRPVIDMSLKQACIVRPDLPPRNNGTTNPLSTLKRNLPLKLPGYSDPETDSMNPYAASSPLENHYQAVDERLHGMNTYLTRAMLQEAAYAAIDDNHGGTTGPIAYPRMLHISKPLHGGPGQTTLYPRNLYEASI